jgi:hypothetical protein
MQSLLLHLSGPARSWLRKLPDNSIESWAELSEQFIKNFRSMYKRPASIEEVRACIHNSGESMRSYIQCWNIIKNSAKNVSDERAIDAFSNGLRRKDFIEEFGWANPKTIAQLMDISNRWADGEDAFHNKQARSPEEDRYRRSHDRRRRFNEYAGQSQVEAGFAHNDNRKDEYRSGEYRGNNRDTARPSKPTF